MFKWYLRKFHNIYLYISILLTAFFIFGINSLQAVSPKITHTLTWSTWEKVWSGFIVWHSVPLSTITIDSSDNIYIAYRDGGTHVQQYNWSTWSELLPQATTASVWTLSINVDSSDNLYIAYGDDRASVKKYNGTSWDWVGSGPISTWNSGYHRLAFDSTDTPYIIYTDSDNDRMISVKTFNGSSWESVWPEFLSGTGTEFTDIEIDSNDEIYISYTQSVDTGRNVSVKKFNGSTWDLVWSEWFLPEVFYSELSIDENDTLFVTGTNYGNNSIAIVKTFNGTSWESVGSDWFTSDKSISSQVLFDNYNAPYYLYSDNELSVNDYKASLRKRDWSNWNPVGPLSFSDIKVSDIHWVINSSRIPYVIYETADGNDDLIVERFVEGYIDLHIDEWLTSLWRKWFCNVLNIMMSRSSKIFNYLMRNIEFSISTKLWSPDWPMRYCMK